MRQKLESFDLTDQQLEESYWLVTHWKKIERGVILFLIIANAIIFLFLAGSAIKMYLIDRSDTREFGAALVERFSQADISGNPAPLMLGSISVLRGSFGRSDLVIPVENPNAGWRAVFDIVFSVAGEEVGISHAFLYPNEKTYIATFGVKITEGVTGRIANLAWKRLQKNEIKEISNRRIFTVSETAFARAAGKTKASFWLTNASAYGYWSLPISAVLFSDSSVVAAQKIVLGPLDPGEKRQVQWVWNHELPEPSSYMITVDVDVFDPSIYRGQTPPIQKLR